MVTDPQPPIAHRKRPFVVTALILLVLSYMSLSWFGLFEALRHWDFLHKLPLAVPPLYLALRSAFWGMAGLPLVWGLWVGRKWAWHAAQIAAALYAIHYWLDRLFLADPSAIMGRWPFALGLTIICLVYVYVILRLPLSRRHFKMDIETPR